MSCAADAKGKETFPCSFFMSDNSYVIKTSQSDHDDEDFKREAIVMAAIAFLGELYVRRKWALR